MRVLVTGAGGFIGTQLVAALAAQGAHGVTAVDNRAVAPGQRLPGVDYICADVRSPELAALFRTVRPTVVVHLASIVTPGKDSNRQLEYEVDVLGSENVLVACLAAGVDKIVVTSSGAAYGYHADNPQWIDEDTPLRGNDAFGVEVLHYLRLTRDGLLLDEAQDPMLALRLPQCRHSDLLQQVDEQRARRVHPVGRLRPHA